MEKLKIEWYVCTYNEEYQLPFAIEYWKRLISDKTDFKVIVYDNYSTDKTVEILKQYDWITVYEFFTGGEMNEIALTNIRNNCWIGSKADWVIVTDLDEVYYSKDMISELIKMKEVGIGAVSCGWYAFCGKEKEYNTKELLHKQVKRGYRQHINHRQGYNNVGKIQLFNPQKAVKMNYSMGMHYAYPSCPIKYNKNIYQFHFDKGYNVDYKINKRKELWNRLNPELKNRGVCREYGYSEVKIRKEYQDCIDISVDISEL